MWFSPSRNNRNRPLDRSRPKSVRLWLERLEDRTVPTAVAPPSGIVSWWAGDGNATDLIGSNAGTLKNGVTFAQGEVANAFNFSNTKQGGKGQYVVAGTTGLPTGSADRSMEMWVNVSAFGPDEAYFAGYGAFGSSDQTYHVGALSDHRLFFSQWSQAVVGPTLQAGQWYHVGVTNVGSSITLYLNGSAVTAGSLIINTPAGSPFYIGRIAGRLGDIRRLTGEVDEVSVYNRALSAAEMQSIYQAGTDGKIKPGSATAAPAISQPASAIDLAPLASSLLSTEQPAMPAAPLSGFAAPPASQSGALPSPDSTTAVPVEATDAVFAAAHPPASDGNAWLLAPLPFGSLDAM